jgi:hypothetical protein
MNVTHTLIYSLGKENFCLIHVSLVPVLGVVGEQVNKSSYDGNNEFCLSHLLSLHVVGKKICIALFKSSILTNSCWCWESDIILFFLFVEN